MEVLLTFWVGWLFIMSTPWAHSRAFSISNFLTQNTSLLSVTVTTNRFLTHAFPRTAWWVALPPLSTLQVCCFRNQNLGSRLVLYLFSYLILHTSDLRPTITDVWMSFDCPISCPRMRLYWWKTGEENDRLPSHPLPTPCWPPNTVNTLHELSQVWSKWP